MNKRIEELNKKSETESNDRAHMIIQESGAEDLNHKNSDSYQRYYSRCDSAWHLINIFFVLHLGQDCL